MNEIPEISKEIIENQDQEALMQFMRDHLDLKPDKRKKFDTLLKEAKRRRNALTQENKKEYKEKLSDNYESWPWLENYRFYVSGNLKGSVYLYDKASGLHVYILPQDLHKYLEDDFIIPIDVNEVTEIKRNEKTNTAGLKSFSAGIIVN